MKRLLPGIVVGLLTFATGSALVVWRDTSNANVRGEQAAKRTASELVCNVALATPQILPIQSLPAELQRIDEMYKKRCRIPTEWRGGWPTIKQLDEFGTCNDEWAKARREVVNAVRAGYLVTD
jgi:hypothetical protein